ncbi:MAG: hypothetical protein PHE09_05910 [Oscillospiraceae bacterium]|nr:hypothetical protein [Oscillospiraceae bacterium]
MKVSTLWKISALAGAAAIGTAAYKMLCTTSNVALTGAGYAGIFAKDGKPVGAFVSTGMRPHSFAGLASRTCGWVCAVSASEAVKKRMEAAKRK